MITRLTKAVIKLIHKTIDGLFNRVKSITLDKSNTLSLPGIYRAAAVQEGVEADSGHIDNLSIITSNYLDSVKERAKARVVATIQSKLGESNTGKLTSEEAITLLHKELKDVFDNVSTQLETIVETEATKARNMSVLDGVLVASAAAGVPDPVVFFIVVNDENTCEECLRLHVMPDGITPRLWFLSEIGHSYHHKGEAQPKISGCHPNCRCAMTQLLPGYTFKNGKVNYHSPGHSEIDTQRTIK